ncbi:MAG: HAMP domain-containing histidine kinase [Acidobacteriota bacterium]|nr:HAMP domain-containing histidine kinase [Acidobacteriota bacterium]
MKLLGRGRQGISLRARVTSWYVCLLAVTLIVFSAGIYVGMRSYLNRSLQQSLSSTAASIHTNLLAVLPEKGEAWVFGEIRESYPATSTDRVLRVSSGGVPLYESGVLDGQSSLLRSIPIAQSPRSEGEFHSYRIGHTDLLLYAVPFEAAGGRSFVVEVGGSLTILSQTLRSLARLFFVSTPLILLAAALGGYLMMRRPLRPLYVLTEKAEGIGRNQLGERLPLLHTNDELERLTQSLNRMIDRLEEALSHNYRFSADASHELRTPLTIMRGELDEVVQEPGLSRQGIENLISTLDEVDRMSRIVDSLMAITRLDAGGERMAMQEVNLSALARTTIDHMRLLAVEKELPISLDAPHEICIVADAMRTKQVLVNLIDNAIKYTPEPQAARGVSAEDDPQGILVRVFAAKGRAVLKVSDHGIGIPPDSLPHVFERFYRADVARSRGSGGVGLGLAIVKSIVTAHQGSVVISSTEGEGSTVTVEFPLARVVEETKHFALT